MHLSGLCVLLLSIAWWQGAHARWLGALVLPHGGIAYMPNSFNTTNTTAKMLAHHIHRAARAASTWMHDQKPDVLLLSTPHGLAADTEFLWYLNPRACGRAQTDNCDCPGPCCDEYCTQVDSNTTRTLLAELQHKGFQVAGLSGFGPPAESSEPMPLKWGETIPLSFLQRPYTTSSVTDPVAYQDTDEPALELKRSSRSSTTHSTHSKGGRGTRITPEHLPSHSQHAAAPTAHQALSRGAPPQLMIVSMPSRRYEQAVGMIDELLGLGRELHRVLDQLPQRVGVVISADLAHTHDVSGSYGFSEAAGPFDDAVGAWLSGGSPDRAQLLVGAASFVDRAKSCGFTGLVLLQGLVDAACGCGSSAAQQPADKAPGSSNSSTFSYTEPDVSYPGSRQTRCAASEVLALGHPSYYGMMVAELVFHAQSDS